MKRFKLFVLFTLSLSFISCSDTSPQKKAAEENSISIDSIWFEEILLVVDPLAGERQKEMKYNHTHIAIYHTPVEIDQILEATRPVFVKNGFVKSADNGVDATKSPELDKNTHVYQRANGEITKISIVEVTNFSDVTTRVLTIQWVDTNGMAEKLKNIE